MSAQPIAMPSKTHYRKAFDSPYLSSADITETTRLTIKCVRLESDRTKKTKDAFNTAHFAETEIRPGEKLKPMILNAGNSKKMKEITGSAFIDDWNNVPVNIYVDPSVRFGKETVEGLRIAPALPGDNPATDEQLVAIQDHREAGSIPEQTEAWIAKHSPLTTKQAATLLAKLNKAEK